MISRRELAVGLACFATAGAAYGLTPHRHVSLLGPTKLDAILPRNIPGWASRDVSDLVSPTSADSLSAEIYDEVVERVYQQTSTGAEIMTLMAHGPSQTNELQLHRPEICYPAFGFVLQGSDAVQTPLAPGVTLPARTIVADAPDHQENVLYWTRLGEFFPQNSKEQHHDRLKTAVGGYIADGLLARFSMVGTDPTANQATMQSFIPLLIKSVAMAHRPAFIGAERTKAMTAESA